MPARSVPMSDHEVRFLLWLFPFLVALVLAGVWLGDFASLNPLILIGAVLLTWVPPFLAIRALHTTLPRLWIYLGFGYGLLGICALWHLAQAVATDQVMCDLPRWSRIRLTEALLITSALLLSRGPRPVLAWPAAMGGSILLAAVLPTLLFPEAGALASLAGAALLLAAGLRLLQRESELPEARWLGYGIFLQLTSVLILLADHPVQIDGRVFTAAAGLSVSGYIATLTGLFRATKARHDTEVPPAPSSRIANVDTLCELFLDDVCCALVDTRLHILGTNSAFASAVGQESGSLVRRNLAELDLGIALETWCRRTVRQARTQLFRDGNADGSARAAWLGCVQPVPGPDGKIEQLLISLVDVTARGRELPNWDSEQRYRAILEHVSDAIIICDLQGRICEVNGVTERLTGYDQGRLLGMHVHKLHREESHGLVSAAFEKLAHDIAVRLELPLVRSDGVIGYVEVVADTFWAGESRVVLASLRDITDRKLSEERLRQGEARWRAIFEHGGMGIAMLDAEGRILRANTALNLLCGFGVLDDLTGRMWDSLFTDAPPMKQLAGGRMPYTGRHRLHCRCGTIRWVDLTLTVVRQSDDHAAFIIAMLTDVTDAHQAELERDRHQRELERANRHKSRFIASASHDIRQPLQAMTILSHLLDENSLDTHNREIVTRIREAILNLGDMVGSLLDLSKLDAGLVVPEMTTVSLNRVVKVVEEEFLPVAQAKGLCLKVNIDGGICVHTDRHLLMRVLRNLVANAVRYTERGEIQVLVRREGAMAAIEVADTGIGIPESEFRRIFEEFQQVNGRARKNTEGLGLGLAIVDHLVHLLGIRIAVDSQLDIGTAFTLWVPLAEAPSRGTSPVGGDEEWVLPGKGQALVLDDDEDVREGLVMMLRRQGYRVVEAGCCDEARAAIRAPGGMPDLVIADYRLPDGTGLDVIRELRSRVGQIPCIVLTGDMQDDVQREVRAESCGFLAKPATTMALQRSIASVLEQTPQ